MGIVCLGTHHDFGGVSAVYTDAHCEQVHNAGRNDIRLRDFLVVLVSDIDLNNFHPVHSQSPCLIRTDGCGIAHGFTGIKMPHQIIVFHHFLKYSIKVKQ